MWEIHDTKLLHEIYQDYNLDFVLFFLVPNFDDKIKTKFSKIKFVKIIGLVKIINF